MAWLHRYTLVVFLLGSGLAGCTGGPQPEPPAEGNGFRDAAAGPYDCARGDGGLDAGADAGTRCGQGDAGDSGISDSGADASSDASPDAS